MESFIHRTSRRQERLSSPPLLPAWWAPWRCSPNTQLPEATPVHEAAALQADLRRAKIEPFAWVINQSFADVQTTDALLRARGAAEAPFIREVAEELSLRTAIVPWVPDEPVGADKLLQLFHEPELIHTKD